MHQLEGFITPGAEHLVCKLRKLLCGLKQSLRQWYKKFDSYMMLIGYNRCEFDCCVYLKRCDDVSSIILMFYVDDMLIFSKSLHEISRVKALLRKEFDMKDLGPTRKILGMEIYRDRESGCLWLTQRIYLMKIVDLFGMSSVKVVSTPLGHPFKPSRAQCPMIEAEIVEMKQTPYAS